MRKAGLKGVLLAGALAVCALPAAPAALAQTSDLAKPRSSVLVVLDSSRAMGRERLTAARRALVRAVHSLPAGTPVGLRVYGSKVPAGKRGAACSDSRAVLPVGPADPAEIAQATRNLKPTGLSPVSLALLRGARDLPPTGEPTIVLVAGGGDSCAPPPDCQTITGPRQPVPVDAIGFEAAPAARRALQCAARRSGGVYSDAATPDALEPELEAVLARATRDRRSLGTPLAGGLEESQATPARPGAYLDSIAPDSERWYRVAVPNGQKLAVAATLVAPPTGDVTAPGSSLGVDASGEGSPGGTAAGNFSATTTNLFAFDPSRTITVSATAPPSPTGDSVSVALHDSPDKQLAKKLGGRSLALELLFRVAGGATPSQPAAPVPAAGGSAPVVGGISFNDAAPVGIGRFSDVLDTGRATFYRVHLLTGQRLDAGASLDVSDLDPALTGTSSLILRLYGPLRSKNAEAQALGPGDPATHLKSTSAELGPVKEAGDYYLSAAVNDFLSEGNERVQLPLSLQLDIASGRAGRPASSVRQGSGGGGTEWGLIAAICAAVLLLGGAAGLAYRRR